MSTYLILLIFIFHVFFFFFINRYYKKQIPDKKLRKSFRKNNNYFNSLSLVFSPLYMFPILLLVLKGLDPNFNSTLDIILYVILFVIHLGLLITSIVDLFFIIPFNLKEFKNQNDLN